MLDSGGFLDRENLHRLKIKALFFHISSEACCGSDRLK